MNLMPARRYFKTMLIFAGLAGLLTVMPARAQKSGSPAPSGPPSGSGSGRPQSPVQSPAGQQQVPLTVNGRILTDNGQPFPEAVSVELFCGMKALQAVHTDLKGFFNFTMGAGAQSNADFSAANDIAILSPDGTLLNTPGTASAPSDVLAGCEIRAFAPNYQPFTYTMHGRADLGRVDVGTLMLTRIGGRGQAPSVSVTSLLVPESARKEFDKGQKDAGNNDMKSATTHLEKAVAQYGKYAAAWNELGRIYSSNNEVEKARPAFEKAVAADPTYLPPYINLANLDLQHQDDEGAVANAQKALEIDPMNAVALLLDAMGNFNLNRLDAAEKSAREAEKGPHQAIPQVHALLANIFLRRQNYSAAAEEMRTYLKESPQGQFAEQMKTNLEQIDKTSAKTPVAAGG